MTALFALIDPSLSTIESAFSTYIYDGVRTIEEHWDAMINAIQLGVLPDTYDLGEFRSHIDVWSFLFLDAIPLRRLLTSLLLSGVFQAESRSC